MTMKPNVFFVFAALCLNQVSSELTCTLGRMVFNDGTSPKVSVLDLDQGVRVFFNDGSGITANGPSLYGTSDEKCAFINYKSSGIIKVVCVGLSLEAHDGHLDVEKSNPSLANFTVTGESPNHFTASNGQTLIFFEGSKSTNSKATGYKDTDLSSKASPVITFDSGPMDPQHGNAGALPNNHYFVSVANPDYKAGRTSSSSAIGFSVVNKSGSIIYNVSDPSIEGRSCPSYHGHASQGGTEFFGCANGILLLEYKSSSGFSSRRLKYHDDGNTESLYSHPAHPVVVGLHETSDKHALIRLRADMVDKYSDSDVLPLDGPCSLAFEKSNGVAFLTLLSNGTLMVWDVSSRWVAKSSIKASSAFTCGSANSPFLVAGYNRAYVIHPSSKELKEYHIANFSIHLGRTMQLGDHIPTSAIVVGIDPTNAKKVGCPADPASKPNASTSNSAAIYFPGSSEPPRSTLALLLAGLSLLQLALGRAP